MTSNMNSRDIRDILNDVRSECESFRRWRGDAPKELAFIELPLVVMVMREIIESQKFRILDLQNIIAAQE